jgi:hypothetical protein
MRAAPNIALNNVVDLPRALIVLVKQPGSIETSNTAFNITHRPSETQPDAETKQHAHQNTDAPEASNTATTTAATSSTLA